MKFSINTEITTLSASLDMFVSPTLTYNSKASESALAEGLAIIIAAKVNAIKPITRRWAEVGIIFLLGTARKNPSPKLDKYSLLSVSIVLSHSNFSASYLSNPTITFRAVN
jgi:hypothetical protein